MKVIESRSDTLFIFDEQFSCIYANQSAVSFLRQCGQGRNSWNLWEAAREQSEPFSFWLQKVQQVFCTGRRTQFLSELQHQGRWKILQAECIPVREADRKIYAAALLCRDITEFRKLQEQLAEQENKYKELYNQSPIGLYRTRVSDGKLLECNKALADLLGYGSVEECTNEHYSVHHYVHPQQRQILLERLQNEKKIKDFELQVRRKDGKVIWVELTAELYPDAGYIEGVMREITAAKILTETEKKILELVMRGKSSRQIAKEMFRSVRTIEDHRAHIMHKLNAHNLVELAAIARSLTK
ncbi:MAG TPA: PAS domain S-box protein [Anaerohalosphaeraceae bacterium]|nr:PAS domain S-box protein [Anaerohalosphaeraceae bacterium]